MFVQIGLSCYIYIFFKCQFISNAWYIYKKRRKILKFQGAEYCLAGLSFVITGVLDSLEREEAEELIKQYGGRTLHQVTKKTDYIIVGDQAGPSKLSKVIIII